MACRRRLDARSRASLEGWERESIVAVAEVVARDDHDDAARRGVSRARPARCVASASGHESINLLEHNASGHAPDALEEHDVTVQNDGFEGERGRGAHAPTGAPPGSVVYFNASFGCKYPAVLSVTPTLFTTGARRGSTRRAASDASSFGVSASGNGVYVHTCRNPSAPCARRRTSRCIPASPV